MYSNSRDEEVVLVKKLISGTQVICPICKQGILEPFHKKAKKSNTDYICKVCGERYQVVKMLNEIS